MKRAKAKYKACGEIFESWKSAKLYFEAKVAEALESPLDKWWKSVMLKEIIRLHKPQNITVIVYGRIYNIGLISLY